MARQREQERAERAEAERRFSRAGEPAERGRTERRVVRSEDPSLSPEANRLLTEEARAAIGRDEVEVPAGAPRHSRERHAGRAPLGDNRPLLYVTLAAAIVVGGIIALVTRQGWVLIAALALHALGTLLVIGGVVQLTTETEHADPEVAARLQQEGVGDPDRALTEIVEDYTGAQTARGVPETLGVGHNERTVHASDDPGLAALEQRTAMTPTSEPGETAGERSEVEALPWWVVGAVSAFSIILAAIVGGEMWVLPAIVVPIGLGWVALQAWMARGPGSSAEPARAPGDAAGAWSRLLPFGLFAVAGVVWFMIVMRLLIDNR
ncbi:MAG TPA: hypothetical protein VFT50_01490 [Baekduia sp.]|nr:hypothetical protein [Baekduia sp.]